MATQTLRRQIERAKTDLDMIKPAPPAKIKVLCEPDPAIGGDSLLEYLLEVREAKKSHDQVFVVCFKWNDDRAGQTLDGVRYCQSDFDAQLTRLGMMPSLEGSKSSLDDLLKSLNGNVFTGAPGCGLPMGKSQVTC